MRVSVTGDYPFMESKVDQLIFTSSDSNSTDALLEDMTDEEVCAGKHKRVLIINMARIASILAEEDTENDVGIESSDDNNNG